MSYEFYKILHLSSLMASFLSLAVLAATYRLKEKIDPQVKKIAGMTHGISLIVVLVSGFGLIAKLGMLSGLPTWIYGKLILWLVLGGSLVLVRKMRQQTALVLFIIWTIFILGAVLAVLKPSL
jgi:hypothetical protein